MSLTPTTHSPLACNYQGGAYYFAICSWTGEEPDLNEFVTTVTTSKWLQLPLGWLCGLGNLKSPPLLRTLESKCLISSYSGFGACLTLYAQACCDFEILMCIKSIRHMLISHSETESSPEDQRQIWLSQNQVWLYDLQLLFSLWQFCCCLFGF